VDEADPSHKFTGYIINSQKKPNLLKHILAVRIGVVNILAH